MKYKKFYLPLIFALGFQTTSPIYAQHDSIPTPDRHEHYILQDETDLLALVDLFNMSNPEVFLKLQEAITVVNLPGGYQTTIPLEIRLKKIASVIDGKSKIEKRYGFIFKGDFRDYNNETLIEVLRLADVAGHKFIRPRDVFDLEKKVFKDYIK